MDYFLLWGSCGLAAYLLGSVPCGYLIAKANGKDIRRMGSGNIGATNVFRSVGHGWGLLTFLLDFLKGVAGSLLLPKAGLALFAAAGPVEFLPLACGVLTVVGHNWTCLLGFKGGKGIATSAGMLLGLAPACVGVSFAVWLIVFLASRYVSLASIAAAVALAASAWVFCGGGSPVLPIVLSLLSGLAVWKHRSNILRLLTGTEARARFGRK